jgi:hypothetical protein
MHQAPWTQWLTTSLPIAGRWSLVAAALLVLVLVVGAIFILFNGRWPN